MSAGRVKMMKELVLVNKRLGAPPLHLRLDKEGNLYFYVVSDGTTESEWVEEVLKKNNGGLSDQLFKNLTRTVLMDGKFTPTMDIVTEVVIMRQELFEDKYRNNRVICVDGTWRKLETPSIEQGMLIMKKYSPEEFRLLGFPWVMTMHNALTGFPRTDCYEDRTLAKGFMREGIEVAFAFALV